MSLYCCGWKSLYLWSNQSSVAIDFSLKHFFFVFNSEKKKEKCKYEWKIERKWMEKGHSISGKCVERSGMAKKKSHGNEWTFQTIVRMGYIFFSSRAEALFFPFIWFYDRILLFGAFSFYGVCYCGRVVVAIFSVNAEAKEKEEGEKKHLKNHQVMLVALTAVDFLILFSFSFFALLFNAFHQFQKVWICVYFSLSFGFSFLFALSIANVHIDLVFAYHFQSSVS